MSILEADQDQILPLLSKVNREIIEGQNYFSKENNVM